MNPKYPIYIVSKGRWKTRLTSKALERINVPYYIVVEAHERDEYASVIDPAKVLVLPPEFLRDYDTCDDVGEARGKGPGAARNFCWEHSLSMGFTRHWVMDDNIASFNRLNRNLMVKVTSGTIFKAAEDFVDRYENVAIAGFNYDFFAKAKEPLPAFVMNTRIYSCLLIKNDLPMRWRGRYNEDTDLSLRALKSGLCTIQFNAFLQEKATTQTMAGGNTDAFYAKEGTLPKSQMLERLHPDVAQVVWRFGRWHHHVDYTVFKHNALIRRPDVVVEKGINSYGMVLKDISGATQVTDNKLDDYMMMRSQQMVTTMIDEVGIESTGQWIECMLLNMLRIVNLPSHEAIQYFNEMSKMYVLLQEMSDKRVLN